MTDATMAAVRKACDVTAWAGPAVVAKCEWPDCTCLSDQPQGNDILTALIAAAKAEERESAAKVAEAHKGAAKRARTEKAARLGRASVWTSEIQAEERGEDIAAHEIAAAIRSRAPGGGG